MLALETTDNWAFSVDIDVGGAETYANAASDALASIEALVLWANSPGRGWFGVAAFSWSWQRDPTTGGAIFVLASTALLGFAISAGAHDRLGLPADTAVNEVTGDQPATGTWAPVSKVAVTKHMRVLERGDANAGGSVRPGVPGLAGFHPSLAAIGTVVDAARLAAILATASNPRRCWVYQLHTGQWRNYALGAPTRQAQDTMHYQFDLPVGAVTL